MSVDLLVQKIKEKGNPSVAGLDPKIDYVPEYIRKKAYAEYGQNLKGATEAIWEFNKGLIDALYDVVPAVKPQSTFYEMYGLYGEEVMHRTISYAKEKGLKTCLYSGRDVDIEPWMYAFDYVKVGSYQPALGSLDSSSTNQRMFRNESGVFRDITSVFWH